MVGAGLVFVKRSFWLNKFFSPPAVSETSITSSSFSGQLNNLNPYVEAYTNPFE